MNRREFFGTLGSVVAASVATMGITQDKQGTTSFLDMPDTPDAFFPGQRHRLTAACSPELLGDGESIELVFDGKDWLPI